jgi:F-type H+-transporting ATPase subunit epsilon
MGIKLDVVTAERLVYSDEVDIVSIPGLEGEMGILPRHTPLMTMLQPGELRARKGTEEYSLVVTGGFVEIRPDHVTVLADAAERAEEIDVSRAEAAKKRAEERITKHAPDLNIPQVEAALRRSLARIKVAEKVKKRRSLPLQ